MIQVLNRSFKILEYMSEEPNKAYTLSEIAELIDVSPSTCSHIMKTMEINDYVEKPASRKGYRLGPKPYYLTRKGPYRKDLIISAEPYVEELAEKIKETIVLSIITRSKNYNLIKIDGDQLIQLNEA